MGLHSIAELVNALNSGIRGRVEANAVVRTADIIVDCTRNANHIDSVLAQRTGTPECAVTADSDNAIQPEEFTGGNSFPLAFLRHKFLTPRRI